MNRTAWSPEAPPGLHVGRWQEMKWRIEAQQGAEDPRPSLVAEGSGTVWYRAKVQLLTSPGGRSSRWRELRRSPASPTCRPPGSICVPHLEATFDAFDQRRRQSPVLPSDCQATRGGEVGRYLVESKERVTCLWTSSLSPSLLSRQRQAACSWRPPPPREEPIGFCPNNSLLVCLLSRLALQDGYSVAVLPVLSWQGWQVGQGQLPLPSLHPLRSWWWKRWGWSRSCMEGGGRAGGAERDERHQEESGSLLAD